MWWKGGEDGWKKQMQRQVEAANGVKIEWRIARDSTNGFNQAVKNYIRDEGYDGKIIIVQEKP